MTPQTLMILGVAATIFVVFVFVAIWASRYVKVGPNRALIVSGRLHQMPDGTRRGFRIVKGGGTFVFPIIEQATALSLEVLPIEIQKCNVRTAKGAPLEVDCLAQVKINDDDVSILAAAQHFLSKNENEIKNLVRPLLEKHLRTLLANMTPEEISQDLEACAAKVQTTACADLANMGLVIPHLTIRHVREDGDSQSPSIREIL
jgi:flotillin